MEELTMNRFRDWQVALVWFGILGFLLYLGTSSMLAQDDFKGELVTHSSCQILNKSSYEGRNAPRYSITSSCGDYSTNRQTYGYVQIGTIYELHTTKGNWAHKPFLMAAAPRQSL